jgi:hypothetical protein
MRVALRRRPRLGRHVVHEKTPPPAEIANDYQLRLELRRRKASR